jgi:GNAT superfamily N-acetyltransferase
MRIREVLPDDAAALAPLLSELGYAVDPAVIPARLQAIRAEDGASFIAVDESGEALGAIVLAAHAVLHAGGPVAMITALVVSSRTRGQGVGRMLVERAKAWAVARGCVRLIVTSGEQRADAHAFYPACGLPYTGRRFGVVLAQ